jgi:hypothetical protein
LVHGSGFRRVVATDEVFEPEPRRCRGEQWHGGFGDVP